MDALVALIDFAFVLQSLASITTIVGMWLYGSKSLWGPRAGLIGQVFWWSIMVQSSLWGLLPVNIAMFVIHGRAYIKWRRDA